LFQNGIATSIAAMCRQEVHGHERAEFQQLEKLQAQDSAQIAKNTSPVLPAEPQIVAYVEESAQSSRPVEHNHSPGLAEAQVVTVEVEADGVLNQGCTDVSWRNNPVSQANQVQIAILLNIMSFIKCIHATAFHVFIISFHIENKTCLVADEVDLGDQLWGQDIGICGDEEHDLCSGFNMADVSFDNYEDIFASTQGSTGATFLGCPSMNQDGTAASDSERSRMQSSPEAELFRPLNVRLFPSQFPTS